MVVKLKKYGNLLSLVIYYRNKVIKKNIFYWISLSSFIILHSLSLSALSPPFSSIFFHLARIVQALIAIEESILHRSNHTIGDTCRQRKVQWSAPSHHFDHRPVWWAVTRGVARKFYLGGANCSIDILTIVHIEYKIINFDILLYS